jgi:glyoxylase-like metal-dependent hydrolase (beta-lactamase superfamily II)
VAIREILPGLIRLTLPLPFDLKWVQVHLVRLPGDGWLLIDSGFNNEPCRQALRQGLTEAGIEVSSIQQILLTHGHPDHLGNAAALQRETGAQLFLHHKEQELLAEINGSADAQINELLEAAGSPHERATATRDSFVEVRKAFRPFDDATLLAGGETLETGLGPLITHWTPGHAPGHLCLHLADHRVLIAGDHILPTITPIISWDPSIDFLALYLQSLDQATGIDAGVTSPSHGELIADHRQRAGEIAQHHDNRCHDILAKIDSGELTAHEIVPRLWSRVLSPFNYRFALDEVMAHLEYLRRRGRTEARSVNGALRWRAAS